MKTELPHLSQEGKTLEVLSTLGAGGSKTVLGVSMDGLKKAIAIPNATDPGDIRETKWQRVLEEPKNATFLRENGLLVNPSYEIEEMLVDGVKTAVLSMEPFSELPFEVVDGKNGSETWKKGPLSHIEDFRDLSKVLVGLSPDVKKLAELGVSLRSDSISFAFMHDGTARLFLYDLDGMLILDDKKEELANFYAKTIIDKIDNVLDFEQGIRFDQQGYDFSERQKLVELLTGIQSL